MSELGAKFDARTHAFVSHYLASSSTVVVPVYYANLPPLYPYQILALALGSNVEPNPAGWELGVYDVQLTDCGKEWLGRVVTNGGSGTEVLEEGKPVQTVAAEDLVKKEQDLLVSRYCKLSGSRFADCSLS
jgi:hypothetical protein